MQNNFNKKGIPKRQKLTLATTKSKRFQPQNDDPDIHVVVDVEHAKTGEQAKDVEEGIVHQDMSVTNFTLRSEIKTIVLLALPLSGTCILTILMNIVDLALVGHLGKNEMAAAALANTWFNAVYFPVVGVLTGLDTMLSQSWGAKNKIAFGQWLVTGLFVTIVLSVPMCIALLLTEHVLLAFHLDPVLCKMSAEFMHPLTTSVPFLLVFLAFTKYLQCQHILSPSVWIGVFANIVNLILGLTIIYALDGGFMGASIATAISRAIQLVIMLIYLMWSKKKHIETWPTFRSLEPLRFSKLKRFFGIGIYGGIMVALEAWCFEVMTFLAGSFGAVAVDTHTTMLSVVAFMWMAVPFPLATATSIRVGNLLGAGNYAQCRTTAVVGVSSVAICSLVASGMVFACRKFVGQLFSSEEEVLTAVSSLMFIGNLFGVFDGTQAAVSGLFRGMGRQRLVAGLNLVGFWVIGVPASCILAFKYDLEVAGLWWGLLIGLVATSSIGCVLISRVDWKKEATNAQARIKLETEASGENDKQKANQESGHVQGEDHDGNADVDGNDDGDVGSAQGIQIQEIELPNVKLIGPEV